ncbi:lipase family protein [Botrimarina hoheduenensis]|uniref:Lipase (Class 3) n=1 Tax=Botrimarina hoheduenensis TaxID=2528000 RepID=A0A5C5WFR6_9BACT|nr:lipase family protein [Botrimarina hoheduenensis]TWT48602.1 Lipase (class 3) [Botrimarina hoheduenensis]
MALPQPKQFEPLPDHKKLPSITRLAGRGISDLSFLEKSLLFAELSRAAYFNRDIAGQLAEEVGLPEVRFYDRDGAQAYIFGGDEDAVVCCRGTEPHEWNDIRADINALTDAAETIGRVHRGFKREVDDLWPRLEQALVSNERTLWFTGHSLGGAMTAICAGRCYLSHIRSNPEAVFTFGAPRVGDKRYVNHVDLPYYRWVNNNDIVPRVPPRWMGYRHSGAEIYLNRRGRISSVSGLFKARDRWWGFVRTLRRWRIDHFSDHLMSEYLRAIRIAVEQEETGGTPKALLRLLEKAASRARPTAPSPAATAPAAPAPTPATDDAGLPHQTTPSTGQQKV